MEFKTLLDFISLEDRRLNEYYSHIDKEKHVLARTVKLSEEMGEFCEQILGSSSLQRKEKMAGHDKEKLSEEFADVVLTACLVAKSINIDIENAIENKIAKINKRY